MSCRIAFFIFAKVGKVKSVCAILFCMQIGVAYAGPSELIIDSSIKPSSSHRYIRAVHKEIEIYTNDLKKLRYAIVDGMLTTKGYAWVYEGEGDGYILARFDYRGNTNVVRIEYDESMVQLKYHSALGQYVCQKLVADICYKNEKGYYKYVKNLRKSIENKLRAHRGTKLVSGESFSEGSLPSVGYEIDVYRNPIPFQHYVDNLDFLLQNATGSYGWRLSKEESGRYFATILHRGYDMKTELVVRDNSVRVELVSASRADCDSCKVEEEEIVGWLIKLRRSIAYDVTLAVRENADD